MDAYLVTILGLMSGAIFRLWLKTESLQKEHAGCQVSLTEYRTKLDMLTAAYNELQRQAFAQKLTTNDAYVLINDHCIITGWSEGATRLFGWSGREAIGKNFVDLLVPSQNKSECKLKFQSILDSKETYFEDQIEVTGQHRNGQTFPILVAGSGYKLEESWTFVGILRTPNRIIV